MCGRLDFSESKKITQTLGQLNLPLFQEAFNIAPTDPAPVIIFTDKFELRKMRWWLTPSWVSEPSTKFSMFNARSDSITTSKAFRVPFQKRRCLVPVNGFYEWHREGKVKTPFLITSEKEPMLLGGVWDIWERDGACIESFAIITTDASPTMSWLHDRQPIFIPESNIAHWLNARTPLHELGRYLVPNLPYSLQAFPVSNSVGNSRVKAPISIIGEPEQIDAC